MRFSPTRRILCALRAICLLLAIVLLFISACMLGVSLALGLTVNAALFAALSLLFSAITCVGFVAWLRK